ncbi:MAG: alpha/beta hydrolase family esterase [Acidimicrobiales bacterium]
MKSDGRIRWSLLPAAAALLLAGLCGACSSAGSSAPTTSPEASAKATGPPVPSAGCAVAPAAAISVQRQDITVGGVDRWYLLTTPSPTTPSPTAPSPTTPGSSTPGRGSGPGGDSSPVARPLVLDFHGLVEGATIHAATSRFGDLAQKDGFVAAFPEGTGSPVQWDTSTPGSANADLAYVTAVLDQLEQTRCIDTSRVYASGFSDGAFMVSQLACTMSGRFAAIAAVSGLQLPKPCPTVRRVPILTFHGTADPILYFNGGLGSATLNRVLGLSPSGGSTTTTTTRPAKLNGPGYPATVQAWSVKDGCSPASTDSRVASQVIRRSYHCPAGTDVVFYIILGGGHAWPGSAVSRAISAVTGYTTFEISATTIIWSFFQRFQL